MYLNAWKHADHVVPLAIEICRFFQHAHLFHDLEQFLTHLPDAIAQHERIQLALADVALAKGEYDIVRTILQREFCTNREGEISLTDLWFTLHLKEAEAHKGNSLTESEQTNIITQNPPPDAIDFRMV